MYRKYVSCGLHWVQRIHYKTFSVLNLKLLSILWVISGRPSTIENLELHAISLIYDQYESELSVSLAVRLLFMC